MKIGREPNRPPGRKAGKEGALDRVEITASKSGSRLKLRVKPGARRTVIEGEHGGALRITVGAAPERGRANDEVVRLLAAALEVPRSAVEVVAGHSSRDKIVEIDSLAPAEVRRRLSCGILK
jgi:hypothetical protein